MQIQEVPYYFDKLIFPVKMMKNEKARMLMRMIEFL